jgi:hypothetical protein
MLVRIGYGKFAGSKQWELNVFAARKLRMAKGHENGLWLRPGVALRNEFGHQDIAFRKVRMA